MLVNPLVKTPASRATCQQQRPRFSDCALHDMTRDKASVQCYPMPPAIRKEVSATGRQRECGPGLREETSGVRNVRTKNRKDRHTGHLL
jgi:hypothetical protein